MNRKQWIVLLVVAALTGGVGGYLGSYLAGEKVTAYHLAKAQDIIPFLVRLPIGLTEEDTVFLEIVGEDGVVDSARITSGANLTFPEPVKIFVIGHRENSYSFSVVTDTFSKSIGDLELGEARLGMWAGFPHRTVHATGEFFAYFGSGDSISSDLSNDTLGLQISVKRDRSPSRD